MWKAVVSRLSLGMKEPVGFLLFINLDVDLLLLHKLVGNQQNHIFKHHNLLYSHKYPVNNIKKNPHNSDNNINYRWMHAAQEDFTLTL